ncbi:MAG: nucleotidyltransferase [Desulfovibrionaceae bacterium]
MSLDLQKHFVKFHEAIELGNLDDTRILREKRELLIAELNEKLEDGLSFSHFNQGSYAMGTGIVPKDGDYDIDVGLLFNVTTDDFKNPVELKEKVYDALDRASRNADIRRSCVTVQYVRENVPQYHVDLAIYAKDPNEYSNDIHIAKGKRHSAADKKFWEKSDPKGLLAKVNKYSDNPDERAQMRRVIRYLKKWRDKALGSQKPYSITLTVCVLNHFTPKRNFNATYNDLEALILLVDTLLFVWGDGLKVMLPVEPFCDLNADLTDIQMDNFKEALETLKVALLEAADCDLETDACKILRKQFGDDFPVPTAAETSHKTTRAVAPAGASA